jgi:acetyl-CoA acetyltransferase family protein
MKFERTFIPLGGGWSSPFARWQGPFSTISSYDLAIDVTRDALDRRGIPVEDLTHITFGWTIPQMGAFNAAPGVAARLGADAITGPLVMQSCATGIYVIANAAMNIEAGEEGLHLALCTDRLSNGPLVVYPQPQAQGGVVETWDWVLDNFRKGDPWMDGIPGHRMIETAEIVAKDAGVTREEVDEATLLRYEQYQNALKDDRAFQRRYMVPVEVPVKKGDPVVVETDTGVFPTTKEALARLEPELDGGTHSYGAQTHPADGTAGTLLTSEDRARSLGDGEGVVQVLAAGFARDRPGRMPAAPFPAAERALADAGLTFDDVDAVTTHNPFTINDIWFSQKSGIPLEKMNVYGSSLVFGHPHAATGNRLVTELIETLRLRGGGIGVYAGCSAGDTGASLVVRVED